MRLLAAACGVLLLGLGGFAQLERVQDMAYANKPFNPEDVGLVMRAVLRDNDAANIDPVVLTRITVENLGTAEPEETEWVEVRLDLPCGREVVLARFSSFPFSAVLLSRPPEERTIPDDEEAVLTVWVKVRKGITEGHTLKPKVALGWAEGKDGGTIEIEDGAPETFVVAGSFAGQALAEPQGGILNPGDRFPVLTVEIGDTADVNPWGLELTKVRVDGDPGLLWTLDNGITKLEVPAARDLSPAEPMFVALDEAKGILTLWVEVPPSFLPQKPIVVAPSLTMTVSEVTHDKTFKFSDPSPDTVVAAGLEVLEVKVPQAGQVLTKVPPSLAYATLILGDRDRNATPITLRSLRLQALGTVSQIGEISVTDAGGRLVGFGQGITDPVKLANPDGTTLLLPDEADQTLSVELTFTGRIPLGGSLLLSLGLEVEEILPPTYLARSDALTKFKGTQVVSPTKAVFFGRPTVKLAQAGETVVVSTDGETVALAQGSIKASPGELVKIQAQAVSPYRLRRVEGGVGELSFTVEADRAQARAGDLVALLPKLLPVRVPEKDVKVTLSLELARFEDWAGISLPFTLAPAQVTLGFTVPKLGFEPHPEEANVVRIQTDTPISSLTAYIHFNPELPVTLAEVRGVEPYLAEVVEEEEPQPGRVLVKVALPPEAEPRSGSLATLVFTKAKGAAALELPLTLEVLEVRGLDGAALPFALDPETLTLTF